MPTNALNFLVASLFSLVEYVLVIRLLLVFSHISFLHPAVQFINRLTRPVIAPLRRFLPNAGRIESATLLVLIVVECLKLAVFSMMNMGLLPVSALLLYSLTGTLRLILQAFFYAILIQVILSWIQPDGPATQFLTDITDPLMRPARRLIPPLAGIDVSPIPVLIGLQFLSILLP